MTREEKKILKEKQKQERAEEKKAIRSWNKMVARLRKKGAWIE